MMDLTMQLLLLGVSLCCSLLVGGQTNDGGQNLLRNPDFETDLKPDTDWGLVQADVLYSGDAESGDRSIILKNRTSRFGGVKQKVYSVERNTTYYMSAYFKTLENSTSALYYKLRLWVCYQFVAGEYTSTHFARLPNLRASPRWRKLGGDFTTPDKDMEFMEMYFEMDAMLDYQMDSASLVRLDPDPLWKDKANVDIRKYRTNSVMIRGRFPGDIPYCRCKIQVNQTRSDFGFGTAIQSDRFIENTAFGGTYRQFHYDHFNWAVLGNTIKWKPMEPQKGNQRFQRVDKALKLLLEQNITIRGHSELWGVKSNNPDWVQPLEGDALMNEVIRRVEYLVERYKGKIAQWDVVNEWLHGTFFDVVTNNPHFQDEVFNLTRTLDRTGKLYINDYQGLRLGDYTSAFVDEALELKFRGVPVDGIGIQSHLRTYVSPEILKKRLDVAAAGGFPLVITELSIHNTDADARAAFLDEVLLLYFSHPSVKAILFWFVSDQPRIKFEPEETVLFTGEQFQPNAAGKVFLKRRAEWQTHIEFVPEARSFYHTIDAFHGSYEVKVYCMGDLLQNMTFYLNPGADMTLNLDLEANDFPEVDPALNDCDVTPPPRRRPNCRDSYGCRRRNRQHKQTRAQAVGPQRGSRANLGNH